MVAAMDFPAHGPALDTGLLSYRGESLPKAPTVLYEGVVERGVPWFKLDRDGPVPGESGTNSKPKFSTLLSFGFANGTNPLAQFPLRAVAASPVRHSATVRFSDMPQ